MKYRKKPVVIEAMQHDGSEASFWRIQKWAHEGFPPETNAIITPSGYGLTVRTMEGPLHASKGDYIIKGIQGEFYPCKPDIFEATYEAVEE